MIASTSEVVAVTFFGSGCPLKAMEKHHLQFCTINLKKTVSMLSCSSATSAPQEVITIKVLYLHSMAHIQNGILQDSFCCNDEKDSLHKEALPIDQFSRTLTTINCPDFHTSIRWQSSHTLVICYLGPIRFGTYREVPSVKMICIDATTDIRVSKQQHYTHGGLLASQSSPHGSPKGSTPKDHNLLCLL